MSSRYGGKAVMAKVRAKSSRRLTENQYRELLRAEDYTSLLERIATLTPYGEVLPGVSTLELERQAPQKALRRSLTGCYREFLRYDPLPNSFYRYVILELEVAELVRLLRRLRASSMPVTAPSFPEELLPFTDLDFTALAEVRDLTELRELLKGTPYAVALTVAPENAGEPEDFLRLEAALQQHYVAAVLDLIAVLPQSGERQRLKRYFGSWCELQNLSLLYRLKATDLSPAYIESLLLPHFGELRPREWRTLMESADQEGFLTALGETNLGRKLGDLKATPLLNRGFFELCTTRRHFHNSMLLLRFAAEGPSAFMAYIMLQQIEVQNLVTMLEGAYYHSDALHLEPLLVY